MLHFSGSDDHKTPDQRVMELGDPPLETIIDVNNRLMKRIISIYKDNNPSINLKPERPLDISGDPEDLMPLLGCTDLDESNPLHKAHLQGVAYPNWIAKNTLTDAQSVALRREVIALAKKFGYEDSEVDVDHGPAKFYKEMVRRDKVGVSELTFGHKKNILVSAEINCYLPEQYWTITPPLPPEIPR